MLHPRARTMLLLSLPAVAIGIASSLILIMVMKIASVLQNLLWQRLPGTLGIAQDSPLWIIGVLTLTGIAVGLVIRFSQGHAGPDPACEPLMPDQTPPVNRLSAHRFRPLSAHRFRPLRYQDLS